MKLLIWDFDGTLGNREGGAWTASLFEVLQHEAAESSVGFEQLQVQTQSGFPWLVPEEPHLHLSTAELWWAALEETFARVFNSADLGYEKPHPRIFELALDEMHVGGTDLGAGNVWMIGDSFRADVQGAEVAGIPAVLVRRHHPDVPRFAQTLVEVPAMLG